MIRRFRTQSRSARECLVAIVLLLVATCAAGTREPVADHEAHVVALGRMVFVDPALSADGRVSCASCHKPEQAYTDGLPHAIGNRGRQGTRKTPSLLDVDRQRSLFWDGRRTRLEEQALDPVLNVVEHGLQDEAQLLVRLRADARYEPAVQAAFGIPARDVTAAHVARALAAFERTLRSGPTPVDRFLRGERDAISEAARNGWVVFDQQAHCTRCHVAVADDGEPALFTDHAFHSLAVGFGKVERKLPELTRRLVTLHRDGRLIGRDVLIDADLAELGRFLVTREPRDVAAFKTPGLRNVARTGPYMHDGSVGTLAEVVDLEVYRRGAGEDRPLILTPVERGNLVAFLEALTSDDRIAVGTALRQGLGPPPAQIRACAANALGSCLGFDRRSGPTDTDEGCGQAGSSGSPSVAFAAMSYGSADFGAEAHEASSG